MILLNLVKKTILLGIAQALPRLALIASAYILTKNDYFIFNKYYYTASIIIIWSGFGFDFGGNISRTRTKIVVYAIAVNSILCSGMIWFWGNNETNPLTMFSILVYSFSAAATGVLLYRLLFQEKINDYFTITLIGMVMFIITLVLFKLTGMWLFLFLFPGYSFMLTMYAYHKSNSTDSVLFTETSIPYLYESGFLSFSINGLVPLVFAFDKFIINRNFGIGIANSYIFAWGLTAPIFYIGNIVEKIIYSSSERGWRKVGLAGLIMTTVMISIYVICLIIIINLFPGILPQSIDHGILKSVFIWMISGYSIYAVFHFPLNGLLFKYRNIGTQKRVALKYFIFAAITVIVFFCFKGFIIYDYFRLLSFTIIILYSLLLIKGFETLFRRNERYD